MRNHGSRFELLRMRPHDHIGWSFSGPEEFASLAVSYLAEGAALGDRLMFVAEDPDPRSLTELTDVLDDGAFQIASIAEVYGASGIVDAAKQRATFAEVVSEAQAEGYRGIRVAADNTSLVLDDERLTAWIKWEIVADDFMSQNPVTGLCAFDRGRVDVDRLRHLATLHPLSPANSPTPQFRLFSDDGSLWIEGEVDSFALDHAWLALENLPPKTDLVVDLTKTTLVTKAVISGLRQICESGIAVTVRAASEVSRHLSEMVGNPTTSFSWVEV